jgi:hypothetical protein
MAMNLLLMMMMLLKVYLLFNKVHFYLLSLPCAGGFFITFFLSVEKKAHKSVLRFFLIKRSVTS